MDSLLVTTGGRGGATKKIKIYMHNTFWCTTFVRSVCVIPSMSKKYEIKKMK